MNRIARIAFALAFVAAPSVMHAQTVTGAITASADIATVFAFGTPNALDFGSVTPGAGATATGSIPFSRNIGVIYQLPDATNTGVLVGPAGNIQPSYTCGTGSSITTIVTAFSSCAPATATTAVLTVTAPTALVNEYVVFKGTLTAAQTNVKPGNYSGSIRITAVPN